MYLLLKNLHIVDPFKKYSGYFDILIFKNKIQKIEKNIPIKDNYKIYNFKGYYCSPGFIDCHVHFRDPGFTHKEDLKTGGKAALKGGFVAVINMANTKPVIDNEKLIKYIINKSKKLKGPQILPCSTMSIGLKGEKEVNFRKLKKAGAVTFSDDGKFLANENILKKALKFSKQYNTPISLHEEHHEFSPFSRESEINAIKRDLKLIKKYGGKIHFQHLSTFESANLIKKAKKQSLKVTAEVTPHHLILTDKFVSKLGTNAKMNPPLRKKRDLNALQKALKDGVIDIVATDHAPHSPKEKNVLYHKAPSGIIGLESAFLVLTKLVREGKISLNRAIESITKAPSEIFNLNDFGKIAIGGIANLTIFSMKNSRVFSEIEILSKSRNSPFIGLKFHGGIKATIHDGCIKYFSKLL